MAEKDELHRVEIKKVLGPTSAGTAVLLGNDEKTFVMFIGPFEGAAIIRELNHETPARPLTHELIACVLDGFDIEVKRIVISDIIKNTFCATLVLEQKVREGNEEWAGKRNEVRIDARPSDCLVLALKQKRDIYCTRNVLDQVRDIRDELTPGSKGAFAQQLKAFDAGSQQFEEFELELGDEQKPEAEAEEEGEEEK